MSAIGFLAGRYLFSRRREKFIWVISGIAIAGVAVGVAALITVLAVMTGFDEDLQKKIVGANPHVVVQAEESILETDALMERVKALPEVKAAASFVQGQVLLTTDRASIGAVLRGIDPVREPQVTQIKRYVTDANPDPGEKSVIVGKVLAERLGVFPGDPLRITTPLRQEPQVFTVSGFFSCGMYDYDANLVLMRLEVAQKLLGFGKAVTGIGLRVDDPMHAGRVSAQIRRILGYPYWAVTWMEQNRNLFAALKLEKLVMFLILGLIVLVACFNIIATLLMMVVERIHDIGILKALGATQGTIRGIFTGVGLSIGGLGTGLGLLGGVGLCEFIQRSEWVKLPSDVYYLDHLPALIVWQDVGLIVAAAFLISLLACWYPAAVAANFKPVDALRYE
ncbi:MAG: ABC transporter permease [Candidatus Omnitrophica bacterium]|nr:ABC transporter permease [Candidatus Omnitrophota bacterium]